MKKRSNTQLLHRVPKLSYVHVMLTANQPAAWLILLRQITVYKRAVITAAEHGQKCKNLRKDAWLHTPQKP